MTYYGRWTYKYEEAARRGAAGVMIVHETAPASYGWATVKNSNTNTMFDIVRAEPGGGAPGDGKLDPARPRGAAVRRRGADFEAAKAAARRKDFRPIAAQRHAQRDVTTPTTERHHLLQCRRRGLPGKRRPDETIIYTAHHDHLGIGQPDANGDRIYNGAIDNAHRDRARARAGARLRPRPAHRPLGRVPVRRRRGEGPARHRHIMPPTRSTRWARRSRVLNTDALGVFGPDARLQHFGHGQARPARHAGRRGRQAAAAASRPIRGPRPAASTARTISPSPRPACPAISLRRRARTWSTAALARGEALVARLYRQALSPARRRIRPDWDYQRHRRRRALAPRGRARPRQFARLAELERGQRIPRRPRPERGRARRPRRRRAGAASSGERG